MASPFQTEAWSEYGVGMVVLITRICARLWAKGLALDGDDYFAALSIIFFTAELVMLELIGQYGSITGMSNEIALTLTPAQTERLRIGSKLLLAGWILYTTLIWCLKACMLFFYHRLTLNLRQHTLVKWTGAICVVSYITTIAVFLTHCHPIHRTWQVYPYPGDDCALNISKYYALVVTNIVTDMMILYIPLPILWSVQLPVRKKLLFGFWLCTGLFIMVATLLRCILCLQDVSQINVGTIWSIRETFVGILAVNLPVIKPFTTHLIRRTTKSSEDTYSNLTPAKYRLSHVTRQGKKRTLHAITDVENGSEERIVKEGTHRSSVSEIDLARDKHGVTKGTISGGRVEGGVDMLDDGIRVTREYDVRKDLGG